MSETKHTPGPWIEGTDGNLRVYGPDGAGEDSGLIAVAYKGRANVKLIAAAPELLEAAKIGLRYFEQVVIESGLVSEGERLMLEQCKAAIAKAEGR